MIKLFSIASSFLLVMTAFSQQDKQFTHYMFDRMSFNPATTGAKGYTGTIIYRNQWVRVQDAPNMVLANFQGNLQNTHVGPGTIGIGMSLVNDVIGYQKNNLLRVNASYHLPTSYGVFSLGGGVGFVNVGFDPIWIPPTNVFDAVIEAVSGSVSESGFDSGLGLMWYGKRDYYVGVSTTHLNQAKLSVLNYSLKRHYYIMAGGKNEIGQAVFNLSKPIYLRSGILIKSDGATAIFDLNFIAEMNLTNQFTVWGGTSYRYSDGIALMIGGSKNGVKVGYSFDIMTNPLNEYGKGSHELMLSYGLFPAAHGITRSGNPAILQ